MKHAKRTLSLALVLAIVLSMLVMPASAISMSTKMVIDPVYEDAERWAETFLRSRPENGEVYEAVCFLLETPDKYREKHCFWFMFAAQGQQGQGQFLPRGRRAHLGAGNVALQGLAAGRQVIV